MTDTTDRTGDAPPGRRRGRALGLALTLALAPALSVGHPAGAAAAPRADLRVASSRTGVVVLDGPGTGPAQTNTKLDWGYVSGTLYLNLHETAQLASLSGAAGMCGWAAVLPTPANAFIGGVCAAKWAEYVVIATIAKNNLQCVKFKFGAGYAGVPAQRYSGGYCSK